MSELSKIMVRSGLLKPEQLEEFKRWGSPLSQEPVEGEPPKDLRQFLQQVEKALEDEDMVLVRETDLGILTSFLQAPKKGALHLEDDNGAQADGLPINYTVLRTGEYVLPWLDENVSHRMLSNVHSYLVTEENLKVFFGDIRELFYGEVKTFAVCQPVVYESATPQLPEAKDNGSDEASHGA